ncbi:hypothetical protein [Prauserella cavernicola]|uniref:Uncharacterized protein n=1 Tax=Prauserella cavernicola TaxID=2800127 RepID=A0A934QTM3_9PSEU|nr:hypothetical protein [Prauserella cavernicola]MBK1788032.1 hypothetical protein [Prauserella cavernicola]
MASVRIEGEDLVVRLAPWERLFAAHGGLSVPLAAVLEVSPLDRPLAAARGGRCGLVVSGLLKIGTWGLGAGTRQFVCARRGEHGLRILLDRTAPGVCHDELIVTVPDAETARELGGRQSPGSAS